MKSPENRYIKNLDEQKAHLNPEIGDQGKEAEKAVDEMLPFLIPELKLRPATSLEDSGKDQIVKDKAIDRVGYLGERPAIGLQITTATDSAIRSSKSQDLLSRPFIRLDEMTAADTAIPRALVFLDAEEVKSFSIDHDISKHIKLASQIIEGISNSLKLDLMKTKNPKEQDGINELLRRLDESKKILKEKEEGKEL